MDYLDNPLPGSIPAGADSRAAKKVRISTGVHTPGRGEQLLPPSNRILRVFQSFPEYAPGPAHFPVEKPATIKLTHYPDFGPAANPCRA
jgi:hypothetical protein